ncbi:MAG: DUF86 domain-containing protein [Nitrococcus sp.]|nr:DUF86 domain-containing protein [Nitrococcus sp.]
MVDDVLLNKAAIIERCLSRIREEYLGHESALETDNTRQDSIVLNLQRACEASIDLAMHVARKERLGLPQDAREAFTLLEKANIITSTSATRMRAMVGFRNIAVHQYQSLSMPILRSILQDRLDDFTNFASCLINPASRSGTQRDE